MSERGNFFAVGKPQWAAACALGLNPAVAYLILARGTGRDNSTTSWSAEAVHQHSGISWRRGKEAISRLGDSGVAECVVPGNRPRYALAKPENTDDLIWLPNELVDGAGKETPPIARLRQTQEIEVLQLFIELYGEQELTGDGGLPRRLLYEPYDRQKIMDMGQFTVYGFPKKGSRYCTFKGPLARFREREKGKGKAWDRLQVLERLGLLEWIPYLSESADHDAELMHALSGDEHARAVAAAANRLAESLPGAFSDEAAGYHYALPVISHIEKAAVVGICRLRYRPKTSRTAAWYAQHVESCQKFTALYSRLARREFKQAI